MSEVINFFEKLGPLVADMAKKARARCTWVTPSGNMRNMGRDAYRRARSYVRYLDSSLEEKRAKYLHDIVMFGHAEMSVTPSDFKRQWQPPRRKGN